MISKYGLSPKVKNLIGHLNIINFIFLLVVFFPPPSSFFLFFWKHFYSFWGKQQLCDTAKILKEPTSLNHLFSTLNLNITLDILSVFLFVILVEVFLRKQGRRWKTRKWDFYSSGGQPPWNVHHTSRMPLHSPLRWNSFLKAGCFSPKHIGRLPWVKGIFNVMAGWHPSNVPPSVSYHRGFWRSRLLLTANMLRKWAFSSISSASSEPLFQCLSMTEL